MRRTAALALAAGLLAAVPGSAAAVPPGVVPAAATVGTAAVPPGAGIIGGAEVTAAPWAAAFYWADNPTKLKCSASVIAPQWVMIADHCISYPGAAKPFTVRVGAVRDGEGDLYEVASTASSYDIALLKLARPIPNPTVVELGSAAPPVGATNEIFGWGRTCASCGTSPVLKTGTVRVANTTDIKDYARGPAIYSTPIDGNASNGDSGGPQFHEGKVVGVASMAGSGYQIYSIVAASRDFIRRTAGV